MSGYIRSIKIENKDKIVAYPFNIPSIEWLAKSDQLNLDPQITFLIGENGTGKSTIIEALAIASGFNPEGGTKNFNFHTRRSESCLNEYLQLIRNPGKERDGFYLRAESFYNVATNIEHMDEGPGGSKLINSYGGKSLHHQSHGESFMALITNRFGNNSLFILDEPEAALSPSRQLALMANISHLINQNCQFIIATHSPILLTYPKALIYELTQSGIQKVKYPETEHFSLTKDFLNNPDLFIKKLINNDDLS